MCSDSRVGSCVVILGSRVTPFVQIEIFRSQRKVLPDHLLPPKMARIHRPKASETRTETKRSTKSRFLRIRASKPKFVQEN